MNLASVNKAVEEAKRFLKAAKEWQKAETEKVPSYASCPLESGAIRRSSMDLTRALAAMRKPG